MAGEDPAYHVRPHGDVWKVTIPGDSQPLSFHATREEAIARAAFVAQAQPRGRIVIHRGDDTVEREERLGPDPHPH